MNDNIVVNHSNCTAYGYEGDDLIVARGDGNRLDGGHDDDVIVATGDYNSLMGGNSGEDVSSLAAITIVHMAITEVTTTPLKFIPTRRAARTIR